MKPSAPRRSASDPGAIDSLAPEGDCLLRSAGHELLNRITGLGLAVEATRSELEAGRATRALHFLGILESGISRTQQQLSDLLATRHALDGRLRARPEPMGLAAAADRALGHLTDEADRRRVRVRLEGEGRVRVDPDLLDLLVGHLLRNALRLSPADQAVELCWTATLTELRIEVLDRGVGITPCELPKLFRPFVRTASPGGRAGLGLGLFLARAAAGVHGGTVTLQPREGGGTVATATLPQMSVDS